MAVLASFVNCLPAEKNGIFLTSDLDFEIMEGAEHHHHTHHKKPKHKKQKHHHQSYGGGGYGGQSYGGGHQSY